MSKSRQMERIMNNCTRCKIQIKDDAYACPLCHGVIKREQMEEKASFYPDVHPAMQKHVLLLKIVIFVSVIAEAVMLLINFNTNPKLKWSLITGVALFYGCFALCVSVLQNRSLRRKIIVQLLVGMLVMVAMDLVIGFQGWSIEIGAPIALLSVQLLTLVMMFIYRKRWQSYLYLQVMLVVLSLFFVALLLFDFVKFKLLLIIASAVVIFVLIALVLFGGHRAGDELKERFRI